MSDLTKFGSTHRKIHGRFLRPIAWTSFLGIIGCLVQQENPGRSAGTSVGTGNPGKSAIIFQQNQSPMPFTGSVSIFGRTQITVPGFQMEPLVKITLTNSESLDLEKLQLDTIQDSLWPIRSKIGDSIRLFNLVALNNEIGGVVGSLGYNKNSKAYAYFDTAMPISEFKPTDIFVSEMTPLSPIRSKVFYSSIVEGRARFAFVYGTGFFARSDSGRLQFPPMPLGKYKPAFVSVPEKDFPSSPEDSANIHLVTNEISQEAVDSLSISSIIERVKMPDAYLPK